jgi:hypothetical protein
MDNNNNNNININNKNNNFKTSILELDNSNNQYLLNTNPLKQNVVFENENKIFEKIRSNNNDNDDNDDENCSRRKSLSVQSTHKKTISDVDSRLNTLDNQSDNNNINVDDENNDDDDDDDDENEKEEKDLFPGFVKKSLFIFTQKTKPRYWCLQMITSPYPF